MKKIEITWELKEKGYDRSYPLGSVGYITSKEFIVVETLCLAGLDEWIVQLKLPHHYALPGWSKGFMTEDEGKELAEKTVHIWMKDVLGI